MAKRDIRKQVGDSEENFVDDLMEEGSIVDSYRPNRAIRKKENKENSRLSKYLLDSIERH